MDNQGTKSKPPWGMLALSLGSASLLFGCFPSTDEILGPYFSGRIELITSEGRQEGTRLIDPKKPVVFRWQPRSHHPLTTMPEAYLVTLEEGSNRGVPLKARVEHEGPYLEVTIQPGGQWSKPPRPMRLGIAAGLGKGEAVLEDLKSTSMSHKPGQGALMTCDGLSHDWSLCWLDGLFTLAPSQ